LASFGQIAGRKENATSANFAGYLQFATNGTGGTMSEKARIDSSGRVLIGTSTALVGGSLVTARGDGFPAMAIHAHGTTANSELWLTRSKGSAGSQSVVAANDGTGSILFAGYDGSAYIRTASITAAVDGTPGANDMPGRIILSTTADGASSPTERMRITSADGASADGTLLFYLGANGYQTADGRHGFATYKSQNTTTANAANSVVKIGMMQVTSRSINAAGTVNASGADYAEYMTKASSFEIAKGDICGATADGKLTNVFADAVTFLVKSTNPSYVGGDTWGNASVVGERPDAITKKLGTVR
jgi:hypothetical protein